MGLYVTYNSERVDPEMFVLLYLKPENEAAVRQYLDENGLSKKFDVIYGELSTKVIHESDEPGEIVHTPVKTLILKMRDEKVLFEYTLSQKHLELQTKISDYVNGRKEE